MSTLGKVCLSITVLLLVLAVAPIPGKFGGWAPKLLVWHNQWSENLRNSRTDTQSAMVAHSEALMEYRKASVDLENVNLGWDRMWTIPARGPNVPPDAIRIDKRDVRLIVQNLGSASDPALVTRTGVVDENGAQQVMLPVVHAFYSSGEEFHYAGEFVATDITANSTVLQPVHPTTTEQASSWPVNALWRLRTMIPSSGRTAIDEQFRHKRRTAELTSQASSNLDRQNRLYDAAEDALATRRKELLGDPQREPVASRPEFVDGLLQVNEDVEEERNQLLLDIDALRRAIDEATAERAAKIEQIRQSIKAPSDNAAVAPPQVSTLPALPTR